MKCKECDTDLPEIKTTLIIDNVEYETETHDFNKILSEINIPKGWRLWTAEECIKLFNSHEKRLNLSDCWFFIKQPFNKFKGKYVAGFDAGSGGAELNCCCWYPAFSDASLGVRLCRNIK
jgi:hypothetical protein